MGEKYIPINKGHFNLDTEDRVKEFSKKMAVGWEENEYLTYRKEWEDFPKQKIIREYPLQVDLELSSACTLRCPMCYTITDEFKKNVKKSFMDFDLFKKIVDEIAGKVYALRLSWRGESSLHPKFIEAIAYAKDKGIKEVSFLTSGIKLNLDFFKQIVEAKADWITVSIDGVNEIYNSVRKPLKFEETLQKIKDIYNYKRERCIIKPTIKIQTIWPAIRNNPEEYYNTFKDITDLISFNPIIDYLGKDEDIIYEENFSCPQLYERVFVASNGLVHMCNSDEFGKLPIGDAYKESIYDIWHGEKLNKIRKLHSKQDGFKNLEMCKKCFYPRKMQVNEEAYVNNRRILIENYINRKQKIGE
ncbi:radical SAM/SPASM domain-containing protein [Campylobacter hyointestinalis]|uniref:Radical SAM/SPASM domain-containing protein n=2 Tax=Campylobacter hyointestinalis TaxID=198 RepID=A0A855NBW1_CAMHY|nr:radical SAM/SPASM domain-containing protein [Campylobacter hyointestinalis]KEA44059.1 radical SAM protein [Campylobacter hyointestinalis subsp. hyointestinalis]PPB57862.1 radical SAM/SPASM domain-containing protein [Campylobacter hyointestinalis subsp. hyointestinalis]PPB64433.1 radical SAM/SPASM domain-containing protein [Campylobacter hyointestinalis subsp. hyointestinalis]PPB72168.1 radical SAM/SPASM domain-containing protein [Campylobacter hyointestinalis subsp. hyointestinalis]QKF54918